ERQRTGRSARHKRKDLLTGLKVVDLHTPWRPVSREKSEALPVVAERQPVLVTKTLTGDREQFRVAQPLEVAPFPLPQVRRAFVEHLFRSGHVVAPPCPVSQGDAETVQGSLLALGVPLHPRPGLFRCVPSFLGTFQGGAQLRIVVESPQ